jgi:hypothetical protein
MAGVMQKNSIIFITLSVLASSLFLNSTAMAGDLEWSGLYRFEGNFLKNSELGSKGKELSYGLHHLVLRPKIVAGDGLTIFGQFDILNNTGYPNSQMGQIWGGGIGTGVPTSANNSNSQGQTQEADTIQVTQLYLTYAQEYGQLLVGRAPLQFGLGITHNAGRGLFDHWYDTRDMAAYKVVVGNLYFMPIIGKPSEKNINNSDDVNDYMFHFQYENPETDLELGAFYWLRKASAQGSDAPAGAPLGGAGATATSDVDMKTVSLYALRNGDRLRLGMEAAFQSGETGVINPSGDNVALGGFGLAAEFSYQGADSKTRWGLKAGTASGDDPSSTAKFEGFIFDRNYDVAMLMFNHPLGRYDFLGSNLQTGSVRDADGNINRADVEAISNVMYVAPSIRYNFNDRWSWDNTVITGWLADNPMAGSTPARDPGKELGYEFDTAVNFSPRKGVMWVNQAGFLFPGSAWKGDGQFESKFSFGVSTKAAISF